MTTKIAAATALAALALAGAAHAAPMDTVGYTLSDDGASLVVIPRLDLPDAAREIPFTFSGGASTFDSIAFRPNGRRLYGYSNSADAVFEIDVDTGAARFAARLPIAVNPAITGLDFNNALDAARLVTSDNDNFVFFPSDQAVGEGGPSRVAQFNDLVYVAGDANEGVDPAVIGNAYTNAVFPPPASVVQYVLDQATDDLAVLGNNAGTLETVGETGLDFGAMGGFDILSPSEGSNEAFALLSVGGDQAIYAIDLDAGTAALATAAPTQFGPLDGFAVAPVPVPAAFGMLSLGLAGLMGLRRARRA